MAICVIRVICETLLHNICGKSAYLRNLRETFYGKVGWVDADAPRRVPTRWDIGVGWEIWEDWEGGVDWEGEGRREVGQKVRTQERPAEVVEA